MEIIGRLSQESGLRIPPLPIISFVKMGQSLIPAGPQILYLQNEYDDNNIYLLTSGGYNKIRICVCVYFINIIDILQGGIGFLAKKYIFSHFSNHY